MNVRRPGLASGIVAIALLFCAGCGGGNSTAPPAPGFTVALSSNALSLSQDATSAPINVSVSGVNGFTGTVQVSFSGLPSGLVTNPSGTFSVASGSSTPVVFGAAGNAATGSFTVMAQGTSGSISNSTSLSLTIQASAAQAWPRTTYARTDAVLAFDDPAGEPHHRRLAYDSVNQHLFVANRAMNRVEVFSTTTQTNVTEITVPGASSADLSSDGTTVWVGTTTQQVAAIDTAALAVNARYEIAAIAPLPNTAFDLPEELVAMSSGEIYMRLREPAEVESLLALWSPAANTVTNLTSSAPALFQSGLGVMARTGDQTKLLVAANDASGEVGLYDASGNVLAGPKQLASGMIPLVAANSDGSAFAVALTANGSTQLYLLSSSLGVIAGPVAFAPNGLTFSSNGNFLYASASPTGAPAVTVFNASTLQVLGQVADAAIQGVHSEIEMADATQLVFGIANRGVAFVDAANPVTLPPSVPAFASAPVAQPAQGATVGGTSITMTGQNFLSWAQVKFGAQSANNVSVMNATQIQANSPPSAVSGAANLSALFSGGWLTIAPEAFSYGPQILEVLPNAGSPNGGETVQIYGYGFGSSADTVTVTIGGASANVQSVSNVTSISSALGFSATYPFSLEEITVQTPPGSAGEVNVTVTTNAGSATVTNAFQYVQSEQVYARQALYKFLTYDQQRQYLYLSDTDHVDIFDLQAGAFKATGLTLECKVPSGAIVPGPCPSAGLRGLSLMPDNSTLVAADFGSQNVYLLDPDAPGTVTMVPVGGVAGFLNSGPARVAATSAQTVFVGMSGEGGASGGGSGGCSGCLSQMNLSASPPTVQPAPQPIVTSLVGAPLLAGNPAGSAVVVAFDTASGGPVAGWAAAAPNQFAVSPVNELTSDLAISSDGTMMASRASGTAEIRSSDLSVQTTPTQPELEQLSARVWAPGMAMHPSGALLYQPFLTGPAPAAPPATDIQGGIDIVDAHSGQLRLRLILPEALAMLSSDVDGLHGGFIALDQNGQNIFALTTSGLTIVKLATVPLGIGTVSPASGPASGGTTLTIRGSGFQSGTTVTIGGKTASTTFVDMNTLIVVTPAMSAGQQAIAISNPNGDSGTWAAAFTATGQAQARRIVPAAAHLLPVAYVRHHHGCSNHKKNRCVHRSSRPSSKTASVNARLALLGKGGSLSF